MKPLQPLKFEETNSNSQQIFSKLKGKLGRVPNLFAAMGASDKLLGGFLSFSETIKSGEFTGKEYEAIALATSQLNGCEYCLSAHTALGKMNGFSEEETIDIRSNSIADIKLNALIQLTHQIVSRDGHPSSDVVNNFFDAGYTKAAYAELIAAIALTTITNYVNHSGDFSIDFPVASSIAQLQES